jgi:hypothetical protein
LGNGFLSFLTPKFHILNPKYAIQLRFGESTNRTQIYLVVGPWGR